MVRSHEQFHSPEPQEKPKPRPERQPVPENLEPIHDEPTMEQAPELSLDALKNIKLGDGTQPLPEIVRVPQELPPLNIREIVAQPGNELTMEEMGELGYKPSFFNRLAKNPWAKKLFHLVGAANALKGLDVGIDSYKKVEQHTEIQKEIVTAMYESSIDLANDENFSFENKLEPEKVTVKIDNDTLTGREILDLVNDGVTAWIQESNKGLLGITDDGRAEIVNPDGSKVIDVFKLQLEYGNQFHSFRNELPAEARQSLEQATGLSHEEMDTLGKIVRDSVLERPDAAASGIVGLQFHDLEHFNAHAPEGHGSAETNTQRLDSTINIATEIIRGLDVDHMTEGQRSEVIKATQDAIKKTIEADNTWTMATESTDNWEESAFQTGFTETIANTVEGTSGEKPMFDRILEADQEAELAWLKVKALEKDPNGQIHKLADTITGNLDNKGVEYFRHALEIDPSAKPFQQGYEHFTNDQVLAQKNASDKQL